MKIRQVITAALVVLTAAGLAGAESAATLLEQGIYAEQTRGDLNEAMRIYQTIVDDAEASRPYASEALYRLGACRLRLGDARTASETFATLATLYPERDDLVQQAEADLKAYYAEHPDAPPPAQRVTLPDPAQMMPPDTFCYLEVGSPGAQVEAILQMLEGTPLANPLALMQPPGAGPQGNQDQAQMMLRALLNPSMVKEFKKIRGFAVGTTDLGAGGISPLVAVLYPGESDALRGILTAALTMQAQPSEPIEGMQVVHIDGMAAVAMDDEVILAAAPIDRIGWVIRQYKGLSQEPSLLTTNGAFSTLDRQGRLTDAATLWIDGVGTLAKIRPLVGQEAEFRIADHFVDFEHIRSATGRLVIDPSGPFVEAAVDLVPGHRNLAYGLIRTPNLTPGGFEAVPADAIGVASVALNTADPNADQLAGLEKAVSLTGLDVGRELFANIEQVTLFAIPPQTDDFDSWIVDDADPIVMFTGLVLTSHDAAKTRALLDALLSTGQMAVMETAPAPEGPELPTGVRAYCVFAHYNGPGDKEYGYLYVGDAGRSTVIALNPRVVQAAMEAQASGRSLAQAGPLAARIEALSPEASKLVLVHAGSLVATVCEVHIGMLERRAAGLRRRVSEGQEAPAEEGDAYDKAPVEQLRQAAATLAEALGATSVQVATCETPDRLVVRGGIHDLAPLGALFRPAVEFVERLEAVSRLSVRTRVNGRVVQRQAPQRTVSPGSQGNPALRAQVEREAAELLGEWVGGIEGSDGQLSVDKELRITVTPYQGYVRMEFSGPFLRGTSIIGSGATTREWMWRHFTHHSGVPVHIYLQCANGELRGSARVGGKDAQRQELVLRRVGVPATRPVMTSSGGEVQVTRVPSAVLGTWVGSIVGPDGQTPADKPLRLTIVPEAGDRVRVVFDGEFVRHHAEMIRQTLEGPLEFTVLHHTQVPVELDLTYENGELRGTARLYAGNTNTPQPMVLRRLPAPPAPQVEPPRLPELPPRPQAAQPARVGGRLDPNVTGCWAGGIVTEGEKVDPNESLQAVIAGTDGNLTLVLSGSMLAKPYTITGGARYNLKIQCVHRTGVPVEIDLPFVGADVWGTARIGGPDGPPRPLVLRRTTPPVP